MLYQVEVAQKKSGNLLVAATPANQPSLTGNGRSEAAPYQSGDAFLDVARAAGCGPDALAAIEEAVRDAARRPDVPIQSRYVELAATQVETLGL